MPDNGPTQPILVVHGGAGTMAKSMDEAVRQRVVDGLHAALLDGWTVLQRGKAALDAVEASVRTLENDPHFNAGKGAVFNAEGSHELDAAIMDGKTLRCGAVSGVQTVEHPIELARMVMERSRHVLLSGRGAEAFARLQQVPVVDPTIFDTPSRKAAWERARAQAQVSKNGDSYGTVGAVARDRAGHLAAATSTGGMTNKAWGRVGDSPIIGAGTYADDCSCAVSCTGTGEEFIRHVAAHELAARIRLAGHSLEQAAHAVIFEVLAPGDGGLIAVGRDGTIAMPFSSQGMYRGWITNDGFAHVAIWDEAVLSTRPLPAVPA